VIAVLGRPEITQSGNPSLRYDLPPEGRTTNIWFRQVSYKARMREREEHRRAGWRRI